MNRGPGEGSSTKPLPPFVPKLQGFSRSGPSGGLLVLPRTGNLAWPGASSLLYRELLLYPRGALYSYLNRSGR